tara:strand:- start:4789 stop:5124 length:336 start_codon:yes stop_codon:yes gene_type:complete
MKKGLVLVLMTSVSFWASSGLAQEVNGNSLNDMNSCAVVYVKNDNSLPNLTIACDGERVLSHTVRTEKQLEDAKQFKADLYAAFQNMVNSDQKKKCDQYDLDGIWWAICFR